MVGHWWGQLTLAQRWPTGQPNVVFMAGANVGTTEEVPLAQRCCAIWDVSDFSVYLIGVNLGQHRKVKSRLLNFQLAVFHSASMLWPVL